MVTKVKGASSHIVSETKDPDISAEFIGQTWVRTDTDSVWVSTSVGTGVADWSALEGTVLQPTALQIEYDNADSNLAATNVKAALDELDAVTASDIPYDNATSGLTATSVNAAIDEVDATIDEAQTREALLAEATLYSDFVTGKYRTWGGISSGETSDTFGSQYTFTRSSDATGYGAGDLETVTTDQPRFVYNPETGKREGLLIEEQRTNLVLWNEDLSNAAWNKVRGSVTSNATTAPNGTQTADLFVPDTSNNSHFVSQANFTLDANTTYRRATFVKGGAGIDQAAVRVGSGSWSDIGWNGYLNLNTGELTGGDPDDVEVIALPNGWFRVSSAQTTDGTGANGGFLIAPAQNDSVTFAGDGVSGIYIWRPQFEEGETVSSSIKTEGSQVTRAADDCIRTLGSELNANGSRTWFVDFYNNQIGVGSVISDVLRIDDGALGGFPDDVIRVRQSVNDLLVRVGGVSVIDSGSLGLTPGRNKLALSESQDQTVVAVNGTIAAQFENIPVSSDLNTMRLAYQCARQIEVNTRIYPRALTAAELQELTAP